MKKNPQSPCILEKIFSVWKQKHCVCVFWRPKFCFLPVHRDKTCDSDEQIADLSHWHHCRGVTCSKRCMVCNHRRVFNMSTHITLYYKWKYKLLLCNSNYHSQKTFGDMKPPINVNIEDIGNPCCWLIFLPSYTRLCVMNLLAL